MKNSRSILKKLLIILFWIGVWAVSATLVDQQLLLPSPISVVLRLFSLMGEGKFWSTTGITILRIMVGILVSTMLGVLMAVLTSRFALLNDLFSPLLTVIKATPVASFIILLLIWIGRDTVPAVVSGLMVLPVVLNSTSAGIKNIDKDLLEMADVYQLSPLTTLRRVMIPSVMPYFVSAIKTSIGMGWKAGIAAEVLTVPVRSIGKMIYESKLYMETTDLFAWTLLVILISLFIEKIIIAAVGKLGQTYNSEAVNIDD